MSFDLWPAFTAALFAILKVIGALYLIYLGVKLWRLPARLTALDGSDATTRPWRIFFMPLPSPRSIQRVSYFLCGFRAAVPRSASTNAGTDGDRPSNISDLGHHQHNFLRLDGDSGAPHHS